jgi:hypothetical protein
MAKISHKTWNTYNTARGAKKEMPKEDIKRMAYDTLFEVCSAWGSVFGANLREAVYCEWWDTARQMLSVKKDSISKERALTVIADLEHMSKEE